MPFDLRIPIGILFILYGGLLTLYGMLGDSAEYVRSLGMNVNLGWGLVLLLFGAVILLAQRRDKAKRDYGDPGRPK
jgi:hypothetical protein